MKKDWEYKKLGEVCCGVKNIRWKDFPNQTFQYIDLTAVDRESLRIFGSFHVNEKNAPSRAKQIVYEGDVIFATTRPTLRRFAIIPYSHNESLCSTGYCVLRPNEELISKWLFYNFYIDNFYNYIEPLQTGASYPAITDSCVKNYVIPVPPLSEQKEIIEYLDSSFAKIDKLKANAAKNLEEAKALFQSALKDALEPKEGWEEKKLQDICQIKGGKRLPKGYVLSSEPMSHRYITVADFTKNGTVVPSTVKYISDEVYKTIQRYTITSDDVYVTIVGSTVGKAGIIPPELDGANLTENACKLVLNKYYDKRFVYYLMCSEYVIRQEQLLTKVSAQPKLALTRLASIFVYMPSLQEQQSIVSLLDSLSEKLNTLQQNYSRICDECDALKQAILRQVFE